jgi:hypothetical protein
MRDLTISNWLSCNTCSDINLCVTCATAAETNRHKCLDQHTFTAMFRIHELSLQNSDKHDGLLNTLRICDECVELIALRSWVRCNVCTDYDLCMLCWASTYAKHCSLLVTRHTFTNMSHRYRISIAPTCAMLCEQEQTLAIVKNAGVDIAALTFDPRYDRAYCTSACERAKKFNMMHTTWAGKLAGASSKFVSYYCPSGWRRFSLRASNVDFEKSVTVYHGTRAGVVAKIFQNGLMAKKCQHGYSAAYVSPSIIYCSHPRYARVSKIRLADDKIVYVQFVVELRVNLDAIKVRQMRETLSVGSKETIDPNFPQNEALELILPKEPENSYVTRELGVHMTGVMVRVLDHDPLEDAESWWWTKWISAKELRKRCYVFESGLNNKVDEATE